ncbi:magnesium transporter [Salsipaludibacter albus]|uniref:magnesium transporter n=1 Tax=Salsipaludibacter albus TaxID=2849650 RepID=UPI001EE4C9D8|nr:magnesium transporter [Salsipaludibacter albus]MBY5164435.1 magnesium transporter [Salsipaludibacter albus]
MVRPRLPSSASLRPHLPEPVLRVLRALGLPAAEVARYWAREAASIRASSSALVVGLAATLIAGTVLGGANEALAANPGLLVLIPAAIGMRGSIFGALAARLGTGILTGEMGPETTRDSFLGRQVRAATLLTVSTAAEAGALAWAASVVVGRPVMPLLDLVAVSVVGGLLASAVLLAVTVVVARQSRVRGWSMDDVGAPVITATGDLVTLPALLLATLLVPIGWVPAAIGAVGLVAAVVAAVLGVRDGDDMVRRIVRESLVVLSVAVSLQVVAGIVMDARLDTLLSNPALLVLIPPFAAACGSLGGMLSSRLASKLHVGLLAPRTWPSALAGLDISLTFLLALGAFVGVGGVGWLAATLAGLSPPSALSLVATSLLGGLFATMVVAVVAYAAAVATFRFGLDPDNHGIPIVTACMDLFGILCLVGAISLMGVG